MADRVAFYCQHVLGIGHLVRSAEIVRQLARDSKVLFISGGAKPDGFRFPEDENIQILQLPPLKTSPDFSNLQVCESPRSLKETKNLRCTMLLQSLAEFEPDVIVTELFPFGRKKFRFELLPLLEQARQQPRRPLVVSSVRDILVTRKNQAEYEQQVCDLVNAYYDLILVHGDKNFVALEDTFFCVRDLRCPVAYTGYVARHRHVSEAHECSFPSTERNKRLIVVSNGSGQYLTGQRLLESVLRSAKLLQGRISHEFQVFAGPLMPEEAYTRLTDLACGSSNVNLSRYTPNLGAVLKQAELSVSMAGYNTIMDVLSSGVRAIVYPVTSNGDQEQIVRADTLAKAGVIDVIRTEELEPEELAGKLEQALRRTPISLALNYDGASNSARILKTLLAAHRERTFETLQTRDWPQEAGNTHSPDSGAGATELAK